MKKLDSNQDKELLLEELKRLRKENKKLASQKDKIKAKYDKTKKELVSVSAMQPFFLSLCLLPLLQHY